MGSPFRFATLLAMAFCVLASNIATASPIKDFGAVGLKFDLTAENFSFLESLDDRGWHLGWFNSTLDDWATFPPPLRGADLTGAGGMRPESLSQGVAAQAAVATVPEPATVVLLGTGLVALLTRRRTRRNR